MKRSWTVFIDNETGEGEEEVLESLHDLTTCLLRLGGVGAISPLRKGYRDEDGNLHYVNRGVHFAYDSYAPGINPEEAKDQDVPVEDLPSDNGAETETVAAAQGQGD